MTAEELEKALRAAPTPRAPKTDTGPTSRRLIIAAGALIVLAIGLVAVGFFLSGGSAPVVPTPTTEASATTTTTTAAVTTTPPTGSVATIEAAAFDPFGEGGENDQLAPNLLDGDPTTEWRTERYLDPIALLKPGVGVTVRVVGEPGQVQVVGMSPETIFDLYWSAQRLEEPDQWERIAGAEATPGSTTLDLPPRSGGFWMIWLTRLTPQDDGTHLSAISELRFLP